MSDWKKYRKPGTQEMRPYIVGGDMSKISVSPESVLEEGGMIAVANNNPKDLWYMDKDFIEANYEEEGPKGKTYHNSDVSGAHVNVSDLAVVGNGDMFKLLCKASSQKEGWMKSTKAMEIPNIGCLVQVTTQQGNNVAEALAFVPGVRIVEDTNNGRKIMGDS